MHYLLASMPTAHTCPIDAGTPSSLSSAEPCLFKMSSFGAWDLTVGFKQLQEIGEQFSQSVTETLHTVEADIQASIRSDRLAAVGAGAGSVSPPLPSSDIDRVKVEDQDAGGDDVDDGNVTGAAGIEQQAEPGPVLQGEQQQASPPLPQQRDGATSSPAGSCSPVGTSSQQAPASEAAGTAAGAPAEAVPPMENGEGRATSPLNEAPVDGSASISSPSLLTDDIGSLDAGALAALVARLRETLAAREAQLARQAAEAASTARVMEALQRKNEELAMARAKVSEQDIEEITR